jgi:plasmid stabilization system protein ParE
MKVVWSASSVSHLGDAYDYLEGENSGAAVAVRRRILQTAKRLGKMPFSGRAGRIEGTLEAVVPRTPYILVYLVSGQTVEILGVWHGARLWPETFSER